MKNLLITIIALLGFHLVYGANYYTRSNGPMNSNSNWRGNSKPSGWNSSDKWSGSPNDTVFVRNEMTAPSYAVNGPSMVFVIMPGGILDVTNNMSMNNSTLIIQDGATLNIGGNFTTSNTSGSDIIISGSMNVTGNISAIAGTWDVQETGSLSIGGDFNNDTGSMDFNSDGSVMVMGNVQFHSGSFTIGETGSFYSEGTNVTVGHANIVNDGYMGFLNANSISTWSGNWDCDGNGGLGSVAFGENVNCATICNGGGSGSCSANAEVSPAPPLPVKWLDVKVVSVDGTVHVEWSTASEENNDYFLVEKSLDGINWSPVDIVTGAGNSTELLFYNIKDLEKVRELTYYRVMQVDFDGEYDYSKIVVYVPGEVTYHLGLYPNPNAGKFYIDLGEEELKSITINNIQGNAVTFDKEQLDNLIKLKIADNAPDGFYAVITVTDRGVTQRNFIKR